MQKYSKYKDSGVKWLGEIPSHWEVKRWRFLLEENCKKNSDCLVRKQLQFRYGDIVQKSNQETDADVLETISKYTVVRPNDIMINGLNLNYDFISQRVAQVREEGAITSAYICLRPTDIANSRYYTYFLKSMDSKKMFHGMGTGIRLTLSYNELKNQFIPKPSYEEQTAIADYLDSVTSKIDEAIAQQQKMIDLLNERKQIIINEAVTKGLDPKVKMKDSGIDWIGQIPEHWEIIKTSYVFSHIGSGTTPKSGAEEYYCIDGIPFLQTGDLNDGLVCDTSKKITSKALKDTNLKVYSKGSLVIAMYGATIGKLGLLNIDTTVNQACCVLPKSSKIEIKYAFYVFSVAKNDLILQSKGGGQPNISQDTIRNERIIVPPREEQKNIVEHIDRMIKPIANAIENANKQIALLQERKQIIINDVVTGKVMVA